MIRLIFAAFACLANPGFANMASSPASGPDVTRMAGSDVVALGEVHDNPGHHQSQASIVAAMQPPALVFEMLSADQAARITDANRLDESALKAAFDWDHAGWPDFAYYYPIIAAAPEAKIYGAGLARGEARQAMTSGITGYFGADAPRFGLDQPLNETEQTDREAFQHAAHCDALPAAMLPVMVELQRLRDAMLARAVLRALTETGGPVVVITGNGHARKDWGLPVYLERAHPGLDIFALGQSEEGQISGGFDAVMDFPAIKRPDPCLAFEKQD